MHGSHNSEEVKDKIVVINHLVSGTDSGTFEGAKPDIIDGDEGVLIFGQ